MKAVIPCARKKEQMFPFSESRPTALMPVMGVPIARRLVNALQEIGVDEIFLVANYRKEMLEQEFESGNVSVVEQEELNGTGGAVEECSFIEDDFLVVNGDVLVTEEDLESLRKKHESSESDATVLATDEDRPEKFGVLSIKNDRVESIEEKPEKPENPLINTGVYMFTPRIFDELERMEGEKDLTDAVSGILRDGDARYELAQNYWIDVGTPEKLWKADSILREYSIDGKEISDSAEVDENVSITGKAVIEDGAELKAGTVIEGRTFIGEDSVIGPNTVIKDSTVSRDSTVRDASVEDAVLFEDNIVDPHVHIENTVMGEDCDTKPGTVIRESLIGARSFIEMNNSIRGKKLVPDARTDLSEITK